MSFFKIFFLVTLIASSSSKSSSTKDDVLEGGGVSSNVTLSDSLIFLSKAGVVVEVDNEMIEQITIQNKSRDNDNDEEKEFIVQTDCRFERELCTLPTQGMSPGDLVGLFYSNRLSICIPPGQSVIVLAILVACASRAAATPSAISCQMAASVIAGVLDVDAADVDLLLGAILRNKNDITWKITVVTLVEEQMSPWKGNLPKLPIESNIVRLATTSIAIDELDEEMKIWELEDDLERLYDDLAKLETS
ncbi:hypothetical protein Tco_0386462 [Tanacetum coccineum]